MYFNNNIGEPIRFTGILDKDTHPVFRQVTFAKGYGITKYA